MQTFSSNQQGRPTKVTNAQTARYRQRKKSVQNWLIVEVLLGIYFTFRRAIEEECIVVAVLSLAKLHHVRLYRTTVIFNGLPWARYFLCFVLSLPTLLPGASYR